MKIPIRTELTVLPADETKTLRLGIPIWELDGVPIHHYDPEQTEEPTETIGRDELKPGDKVLVPAIMGGGYHRLTVNEECDGASDDRLSAILHYEEEPRKCWVCRGLINLRGITRTEKTAGP